MAVLLILVPIPTSKKITNLGMQGGGPSWPPGQHTQSEHSHR